MEHLSFFERAGPFSLRAISDAAGASAPSTANEDIEIADVRPLDTAGKSDISFLDNPKYLPLFANTAATDAADRGLGHLQQLPAGLERARAHIGLLKVKVFAAASPGIRARPSFFDEIQQAVQTAELMGVHDTEAMLGWHTISWWRQSVSAACS